MAIVNEDDFLINELFGRSKGVLCVVHAKGGRKIMVGCNQKNSQPRHNQKIMVLV